MTAPILDETEWSVIENLLACYCREVAGPATELRFSAPPEGGAHLLQVALPRTGGALRVGARGVRATLNLRYLQPLLLDRGGGPLPLDGWRALAEVLCAELSARLGGGPHPEFLELIADSARVQRLLLAAARAGGPTPLPAGAAGAFLAAEQSLHRGHPFHPSPKSRQGFSAEDLRAFSPELGAAFPLHHFAARCPLLIQESLEPAESASSLVAGGVEVPPGYALVPVHPWQARHLRALPGVPEAIERGDLLDLGPAGPPFWATSSVRTLFAPEARYFYKASLSVRITNCLRRNAVHEMQASLLVTRLLRERAAVLSRFPNLVLLEEPAFLSVDLRTGDEVVDERGREGFGLLLRRSVLSHCRSDRPEEAPLVCAALFGNREVGEAALVRLLGGADREAFFAGYLRLLLPPLLHLFAAEGILFEAHLQNVLLTVSGGAPARIWLRDFDNVRLLRPASESRLLDTAPPRARSELRCEAEAAWRRFAYCLFTNHLCDAVATLAAGQERRAGALFRLLRAELSRCQEEVPEARPFIRRLLDGEPLPVKTNLLTRFRKTPDRDAGYAWLDSPLGDRGAP